MDLPLANPKEELETISRNSFNLLFDVSQFEIRPEDYKDKGIDHFIELKKNSKYTNFRFVIQLKATDTKEANKDGSISLQIHTSNINYLLNGANSAYYVLFLKAKNQFLYENLNDFVQRLFQENNEWSKQESHVLRFSKVLDQKSIEGIYAATLKKGLFQKEINERLLLRSASLDVKDRILVDPDMKVSDDAEIRTLVEGIGLELINEGRWKEVIFVHKKASGNVASTAMYNLVLGIANYYMGDYLEALSFLKNAKLLKQDLSEELTNHLEYFEVIIKYSLGLITDSDFEKVTKKLEDTKTVGLYIKVEKAKERYGATPVTNSQDQYEQFVQDIEEVLNDPNANNNVKLIARCELILYEGFKNNMDYVRGVSMINALEIQVGPNVQMRVEAAKLFVASNKAWVQNIQALKQDAHDAKNYFAYYLALLNEVKVTYEFEVYISMVSIDEEIPGMPKPEEPDHKPIFERIIKILDEAYKFYKQMGHVANLCAVLSSRYEVQHFLKETKKAKKTLGELTSLIDNYEMKDLKRSLVHLKNQGTTHEAFRIFLDNTRSDSDKVREEYEQMIKEMTELDTQEMKGDKKRQESYMIQLLPIGYFQFPRNKKERAYEILGIEDKGAQRQFDSFFEKSITPIANIFYNPITQEGPVDGKLADRGIECWRNVHRIRKAFAKEKFYRVMIKGPQS